MTSVRAVGRRFVPNIVGGGAKLAGRLPRSDRGADRGWPAVVGFFAMLGAGATAVALWSGFTELLLVTVPVAVLAGGAALVHVVRRVRREIHANGLRAARAAEPWLWDHEWDERGTADDTTPRQAATSIAAGLVVAVLALPFSAVGVGALVVPNAPFRVLGLLFLGIGLVLDLVMVRLLLDGGRLTGRRVKYGRCRATFRSFPFRRGDRLRLDVHAPPALPRHALVTATLRCVQERYEMTGSAEDHTRLHRFEVYRDTAPAEQVDVNPGARLLRVSFAIPADVPATDLSSYPCRYWEVELEAATEGIDYGAQFLVPVY